MVGTLDSAAPAAGGATPQGFIVLLYNSNSTIDGSFGTHSATVTAFPGENFPAVLAVAVQSNGDIVAAGVTESANPRTIRFRIDPSYSHRPVGYHVRRRWPCDNDVRNQRSVGVGDSVSR